MIENPPELPIFIITGTNFTMEVGLNEYNASFSLNHQQNEAATQAVEVIENQREQDSQHILIMNPDSKNEDPQLGVIVLVHLKNTNPDLSVPIPTYLCHANFGFYKDADKMKKLYDEKQAELNKSRKEQELRDAKLNNDLKNFDNLKKYMTKKSKKNPKK